MSAAATRALIERYYSAFNDGDAAGMLACLADNVAHDVNQGERQTGKAAFTDFLAHMERCYREQLTDIVIMVDEGGNRVAAEFTVNGEYLQTDAGLPEARGQRYVLAGGAFFDISDGAISRVTMYYNLPDWIRQVEG